MLLEGLINFGNKEPFEIKGQIDTWVIMNAKEDTRKRCEFFQMNEAVTKWFSTVFVNYCARNPADELCFTADPGSLIRMSVEDLINECFHTIGRQGDTKASYVAQLPSWVKWDDEILFPYGFEGVWEGFDELAQIQHFLEAQVANGERIDRMSVPDALEQSRRWHARAANAENTTTPNGLVPHEDFNVVMRFPDGYEVWRLISGHALEQEGKGLGHCVGRGGYHGPVSTGRTKIYSVRDPNRQPVATLEVVRRAAEDVVVQCKGRKNGEVASAAHAHVAQFIVAANLQMAQDHHLIGLPEYMALEDTHELVRSRNYRRLGRNEPDDGWV